MTTMMLRKPVIAIAALGLAAVISGCLVSGTKVFTYDVGDIHVSAGSFTENTLDLTTNDTFRDHVNDIGLIDRMGFTCNVVNNGLTDGQVSVYFSPTAGLSDPATEATPLFLNFAVPGGSSRAISYDESLDILLNFAALQDAVESGHFTIYSTSDGIDFTIQDLTLVITFTVGL